MVTLTVYYNSESTPEQRHWDETVSKRKLPIGVLDLSQFPTGEATEIINEGSEVSMRVGEVTCKFQLRIRKFSTNTSSIEEEFDPLQDCDRSATFCWNEHNSANALVAQLTSAVLAICTDGCVCWQTRTKGWRQGVEAFQLIRRAAYRDFERNSKIKVDRSNPFGPRLNASIYKSSWVKCPRCGFRFTLTDENAWDNEKHIRCGQLLHPEHSDPIAP